MYHYFSLHKILKTIYLDILIYSKQSLVNFKVILRKSHNFNGEQCMIYDVWCGAAMSKDI